MSKKGCRLIEVCSSLPVLLPNPEGDLRRRSGGVLIPELKTQRRIQAWTEEKKRYCDESWGKLKYETHYQVQAAPLNARQPGSFMQRSDVAGTKSLCARSHCGE